MKTFTLAAGVLLIGVMIGCSTVKQRTLTNSPQWKVSPGQPTYYINSVAVSGDGNRVIGGTFFHQYGTTKRSEAALMTSEGDSQDGTFGTYCYDRGGNLLWKDEFQGWQGVYWVDVSQDGARAASGGWFSRSPAYAGFVRAYDVSNGAKLLDYRTAGRVNQVVLSDDGAWLISAAESLIIFQYQNGRYVKTDEYKSVFPGDTFITADLSADGQRIVCAGYKGSVFVLANNGGKLSLVTEPWPLPGGGYSHSVKITPDGAAFAAGGSAGNFYLFDVASFVSTRKPTNTGKAGSGSVYGVSIADDASGFVGIANLPDGRGRVFYYPRKGGSVWTFDTPHNPNCVALNYAKGWLAVADGHPDNTPGAFYLLDAASGKLRWQYNTANMSWPIAIAGDGSAVVGGSDDSNIYYFIP